MQKRELRGEGEKGPISEDKLSLPPRLAPRSRSLNELSSHPVIPFLTRREESVLGPTSHRPAPGIGSRAPRRRTRPRPGPQIILTRIPGLLSPPLHGLNEAHGARRGKADSHGRLLTALKRRPLLRAPRGLTFASLTGC